MSALPAPLTVAVGVRIAGTPMAPEVLRRLLRVEADQTEGLPAQATLAILDPELDLIGARSGPRPGEQLVVQIAPVGTDVLQQVFHGELHAVEASFGGPDGAVMELVAYDLTHGMHTQRRSRTFKARPVQTVISQVAREAGLAYRGRPEPPAGAAPDVQQLDETDWQLLTRLARAEGDVLHADGTVLKAVPIGRAETGVLPTTLHWGESLLRLDARESAPAARSVRVRNADLLEHETPAATTTIRPAANPGAAKGVGEVVGRVPLKLTPPARQSDGRAAAIERLAWQADAVCHGDPTLRPGVPVELAGVGPRFGGRRVVVGAVHVRHADGTYVTRLRLGAGAGLLVQGMGTPPPAAGTGLMIAKVHGVADPLGRGRVQLSFPDTDSVFDDWVPVLQSTLGKDHGSYVAHAVDDLVVVGFQHGQAGRPIVLGAVHGPWTGHPRRDGALSAALQVADGLRADVGGAAAITTRQALDVTATEQAVSVTGKGINLDSQADLTAKARTKAAVDAQQLAVSTTGPIQVKAQGGTVEVDGTTVTLKGQVVRIEATGMLEVSAAQVMFK